MASPLPLGSPAKAELHRRLTLTLSDPAAVLARLTDPNAPPMVVEWLSRLRLLHGVPFNYLVPDEGMLPPESIRFFFLDPNWVDALIDGAFSIGRNQSASADTVSKNMDHVTRPVLHQSLDAAAAAVRARALGGVPLAASLQVISGFVLRSSLVSAYPGLGVYAYPKGETPDDPRAKALTLLRFEPLGAESDTLFCLMDGDAARVDIHEAPEHLHYAIDRFEATPPRASKMIHTFTSVGGKVSIDKQTVELDLALCLRKDAPRTLNMSAVAAQIAKKNGLAAIDAATLGFEMTEGVGMVSFLKR